jgi:hypothetical protein
VANTLAFHDMERITAITGFIEWASGVNFTKQFAQRRKHKLNFTKDVVLFHQHFCGNFVACIRQ